MKVPDWVSSSDFTYTFESADIIRPLIPGAMTCELARVGMRHHDGVQIEYLRVGEGVKKGADKYICTKIRVIVGGGNTRTTKLQFVKILGKQYNANLTQQIEPPVASEATKESSAQPSLFEKKCQDMTPSSLSDLEIEVSDMERNAIDEWLRESKSKKYPAGIAAAINWLTGTEWSSESRMKYLEGEIDDAMKIWKAGQEVKRGTTVQQEEYESLKKVYLDFLHHLHYNPATTEPKERTKSARKRKQVKSFQEEQQQTLRSKINVHKTYH
jgi:hypothetical protein